MQTTGANMKTETCETNGGSAVRSGITPIPPGLVTGLVLALLPAAAAAQGAESASIPVLDVLAMGGWICYPIYVLLLVGIALSVARVLMVHVDRGRSKVIHRLPARAKLARELLSDMEGQPTSELAAGARDMLAQFISSRNHDSLGANIERFMTVRQDWFKPYVNWMTFLSDSAGALGLLGTVLGMFQTFFGGTLDKDKILHGMGVALITTLVGIIVSLLLNLVLTLVRNYFDGVLDGQYQKLTEIRQAMLQEGSLDIDRKRRAGDRVEA